MKKGFVIAGGEYDSIDHYLEFKQKTHENFQKQLISRGHHETAKKLDDMHKEFMGEVKEKLRLIRELQLGRATGMYTDTLQ